MVRVNHNSVVMQCGPILALEGTAGVELCGDTGHCMDINEKPGLHVLASFIARVQSSHFILIGKN